MTFAYDVVQGFSNFSQIGGSFVAGVYDGVGSVMSAASSFFGSAVVTVTTFVTNLTRSLDIFTVPKIGLDDFPLRTQVEIGQVGINTSKLIPIEIPFSPVFSSSTNTPVLTSAQLLFDSNGHLIKLAGKNFGDNKDRLTVLVKYGRTSTPAQPESLSSLSDENQILVFRVPNGFPISPDLEFSITRMFGSAEDAPFTISASQRLSIDLNGRVAQTRVLADQIVILDGKTSGIVNGDASNQILATIPVGLPDKEDGARNLAYTADGSRIYVPLEYSRSIAIVDAGGLRPLDVNPKTSTIDNIALPFDSAPSDILLTKDNKIAYVSDRNQGIIYVINTDPNSPQFNQHIGSIVLESAEFGIRQIAQNSNGTLLFLTSSPRLKNSSDFSRIVAINIDPKERSKKNGLYHQQVGVFLTAPGVEAIAPTPNPTQMLFTNRWNDQEGVGLIEINEKGDIKQINSLALKLRKDRPQAIFDVNEAVDIIMWVDPATKKEYAFVVGRNSANLGAGVPSIDSPGAGSNVGVIINPRSKNPQLVSATRPIPDGFGTKLSISGDRLYTTYAIAGITTAHKLQDLVSNISLLEEPPAKDFWGDLLGGLIDKLKDMLSPGSSTSDYPGLVRTALESAVELFGNLIGVPSLDIAKKVLGSIPSEYINRPGSGPKFPLDIPVENAFGNTQNLGFSLPFNVGEEGGGSRRFWEDVLEAVAVFLFRVLPQILSQIDFSGIIVKLLGESLEFRANLYLSTYPKGSGLIPADFNPPESTKPGQDYNPNRVWEYGITLDYYTLSTNTSVEVGLKILEDLGLKKALELIQLTGGQKYYLGYDFGVAVRSLEPLTVSGQLYEFDVPLKSNPLPLLNPSSVSGEIDQFSSVTILTPGLEPNATRTKEDTTAVISAMAKYLHEQKKDGAIVMRFNRTNSQWEIIEPSTVKNSQPILLNQWKKSSTSLSSLDLPTPRPLVLIADWIPDLESIFNTGFAEAAADTLFASLVKLDQLTGGSVTGQYDPSGKLIRRQGAIFNSPLHFIGFGQGAVVNTEIVQRLGTYYPNAGGPEKFENGRYVPIDNILENDARDLHFTVVDPIHYPSLQVDGNYANILDPKIRVWNNVTFADQYYINRPRNLANDAINFTGIIEQAIADGRSATDALDLIQNAIRANFVVNSPQEIAEIALALIKEYAFFDWSVNLSTRYGFNSTDLRFKANPALNALNWYAGTQIIKGNGLFDSYDIYESLESFTKEPDNPQEARQYRALRNAKDFIYRRLGDYPVDAIRQIENDFLLDEIEDQLIPLIQGGSSPLPWYTPDYVGHPYPHGHEEASWEGTGTGWFHSVLGGGFLTRPYSIPFTNVPVPLSLVPFDLGLGLNRGLRRTSVFEDNTYSSPDTFLARAIGNSTGSLRTEPGKGDYAVPTLFNGNFDAITPGWNTLGSNQLIPGWSTIGNTPLLSMNSLRTWSQIASSGESPAFQTHLDKMGSNVFGGNYALKLGAGESITHNNFLVPDWGALRFDLHTGDVGRDDTGVLKVFLDEEGSSSQDPFTIIKLQEARGNAPEYADDRYRIGYGTTGFETFTVDVPERFRGKTATLRFEASGVTVYLDNVFFKSQHLMLGNPTLNGQIALPETSQPNNYLLEKPQYAVSYNRDNQAANWASYVLDRSWINGRREDNFSEDVTLPDLPGWYRVPGEAYKQSDSYGFARGHLAPAADRYRTRKDNTAANIMTNLVPQNSTNNSGFWQTLERDLRSNLVDRRNKELHIFTGVSGSLLDNSGNPIRITKPEFPGLNVNVPESLWKIVLVQERPGLGISDINASTLAFALYAPNDDSVRSNNWRANTNYIRSVREVEGLLGYNFFTNLSDDTQNRIEDRNRGNLLRDITDLFNSPTVSAPLLGEFGGANAFRPTAVIPDRAVWHNGSTENIGSQGGEVDSSLQVGISKVGTATTALHITVPQISLSKVSSVTTSSNHLTTVQIGSVEQGTIQTGIPQSRTTQIGFTEVSSHQLASSEVGIFQVGSEQVGAGKVRPLQPSLSQDGSFQIGGDHLGFYQFRTYQSNIPQVNPNEVAFPDGNPREIPLTSSISLQQFLSSHNYTLQNTTVPTWLSYLGGTTPFNLNIEVRDLPTGQLAEAQVTGFAADGTPNAGTLLLDHNGNDLGWFIDPTPWENSEFTQTLSDSSYRATTSPAAGRYDLLTTILHEMGHLAGLIKGNPAYDLRIQNINGTPTFVGNGFSASLTRDGSHLDPRLHPYDLMNTHLTPGVRKLPSTLNLQMLQALRTSTGTSTGWNQRGDAKILNGQAILSEASPYLSNFRQTFQIPEGARSLQFTLTHRFPRHKQT